MVSKVRADKGFSKRSEHSDDRNNVRDIVVRAGLSSIERD